IKGHQMGSLEFAHQVNTWLEDYGHICYLIGGPRGLHPELVHKCQYRLSLSPLTFPHELARVILLEQLFRAETIINHHQYHK
ncbi:MAG: 23S rRNA (pseudouridine(1915)-N(3))-methyltransferase RlmH, partial [Anaerolineae bacterium]|nr:23S rRNA (pseudouridine(1915)-N(3))-methyltransferase RlmH [Anaerolineae bacterium]